MKIAAIQMTSNANAQENIAMFRQELIKLASQKIDLVLTPENAFVLGTTADYHQQAEVLGKGKIQQQISDLASEYQVWICVGSLPIRQSQGVTSTSLLFNAQGELVAHYDKLHLFDAVIADGQPPYRESNSFIHGQRVVTADTPFGCLGFSICYDLRFPDLYAQLRLQGAQVILVPAAFTALTGQAHWQSLLQARAIETQCWVIGVGQCGRHFHGRETWGHSMMINPWGEIVAQLEQRPGHLIYELDFHEQARLRQQMPISQHVRFVRQLSH